MSVPVAEETIKNESSRQNSDELLVSAAKSGDSRAFVELTQRYYPRLLRRSYRITRNWQDAEDVVQDSLLSAFVHLEGFQSRSTFSSWITQIVINTSLMVLRKRRIRASIALDGMTDFCAMGAYLGSKNKADNPEAYFAVREREQLLRAAILQLPGTFREVIQLRQAKEYSTKELAQVLGISVPAVKSRLSRARRALRATLGKELGGRLMWDSAEPSNEGNYGIGKSFAPEAMWNSSDVVQ